MKNLFVTDVFKLDIWDLDFSKIIGLDSKMLVIADIPEANFYIYTSNNIPDRIITNYKNKRRIIKFSKTEAFTVSYGDILYSFSNVFEILLNDKFTELCNYLFNYKIPVILKFFNRFYSYRSDEDYLIKNFYLE